MGWEGSSVWYSINAIAYEKENKSEAAILRQKGGRDTKKKPSNQGYIFLEAEIQKLIHELEVHQIELEMQNEEILLSKNQAELATKKYTELYDLAFIRLFLHFPKKVILLI